jgi:hypothetical protein
LIPRNQFRFRQPMQPSGSERQPIPTWFLAVYSSTVFTYTVCKGSMWVLGLRQINTFCEVPFQVNFFLMTTFCIAFYESYLSTFQTDRKMVCSFHLLTFLLVTALQVKAQSGPLQPFMLGKSIENRRDIQDKSSFYSRNFFYSVRGGG